MGAGPICARTAWGSFRRRQGSCPKGLQCYSKATSTESGHGVAHEHSCPAEFATLKEKSRVQYGGPYLVSA